MRGGGSNMNGMAAEKTVRFGEFSRDPEQPVDTTPPSIYSACLGAADLIKQYTNGHLVEISMDTHNIERGVWKKRTVAQQIEFKVKITIDVKEKVK